MNPWFEEVVPEGWGLKVKVTRQLHSEQSKFQKIELYDTEHLGRLLVLDGKVQLIEMDEFVYHEMLTHPVLMSLAAPKRVMVIGGGDGGTIREVLRHPTVEKATLVEIDERVIEVCKQHLPSLSGKLSDPRVDIRCEDAAEFIRSAMNEYDAVLVDSSDPVGPSEVLFSETFFNDVKMALVPGGMMAMQAGSPFFYQDQIVNAAKALAKHFPVVRAITVPVPTYPSGTWTLLVASLQDDPAAVPRADLGKRCESRQLATLWYSPDTHLGSMAVPPFLARKLGHLVPA